MARWEPGAAARLQQAALELFVSRGYEQTTAADIARSVGLTERTFFRHFSDKREVLFHGQEVLVAAFVAGAAAAPDAAGPFEVVRRALREAATIFPDERRPYSRLRQTVIDANPALREREVHKLAGLGGTLAESLRARGVDPLAARLAGQSGSVVFGTAFMRWIAPGETRSFGELADEVLDALLALTVAEH